MQRRLSISSSFSKSAELRLAAMLPFTVLLPLVRVPLCLLGLVLLVRALLVPDRPVAAEPREKRDY